MWLCSLSIIILYIIFLNILLVSFQLLSWNRLVIYESDVTEWLSVYFPCYSRVSLYTATGAPRRSCELPILATSGTAPSSRGDRRRRGSCRRPSWLASFAAFSGARRPWSWTCATSPVWSATTGFPSRSTSTSRAWTSASNIRYALVLLHLHPASSIHTSCTFEFLLPFVIHRDAWWN